MFPISTEDCRATRLSVTSQHHGPTFSQGHGVASQRTYAHQTSERHQGPQNLQTPLREGWIPSILMHHGDGHRRQVQGNIRLVNYEHALTPVLCKWILQRLHPQCSDRMLCSPEQPRPHGILFHNLIDTINGELLNSGGCQHYHSKEKLGYLLEPVTMNRILEPMSPFSDSLEHCFSPAALWI